MSTTGNHTTSKPFEFLGMSSAPDLSDPLNFEADDWLNDSPPPIVEFFNHDPDTVVAFKSSGAADGLLSPGPNLTLPQFQPPGSPWSSPQDSSSDSASSKRTRGSASPQAASAASGDMAMTDGLGPRAQWHVDDFLHMDEDEAFKSDPATVNPKSIQQAYGEAAFDHTYDFKSDSSASSPDAVVADGLTSPPLGSTVVDGSARTSPYAARPTTRRHNKAHSVSCREEGACLLRSPWRVVSVAPLTPTRSNILSRSR